MGKRIIQQRRGKGSPTYRVRKRGYRFGIGYPNKEGKGKVVDLVSSPGHTYPLAKIDMDGELFFNPAFNGMEQGQEIDINSGNEVEKGNILSLNKVPIGTRIYNIERNYMDGGRLIRSGGNSAILTKKENGSVAIMLPSKREIWLNDKCRATVGRIAGQGRLEKPIVKAGKKYKMMKSQGRLYPRTSAVCMNVVDHPMGSGRGKNPSHGRKGKIPKVNAPAGAKVGSLRPKRSGKKK